MVIKDSSSEIYWEVHQGNGPYLLLVHGFLSSRSQWILNIDALSEAATPVVVELLGHGRSASPASPNAYHPDEYVKAFENIRRRLGVKNWFVCGQSLGACLTLRYALKHPDRITAQIFTNTVAGFAGDDDAAKRKQAVEETAGMIAKYGSQYLEKFPMHPVNARFLPAEVKTALVRDSSRLLPTGVMGTLQGTMPHAPVRNDIHQNKVPALLVCGNREKAFKVFREFARDNMPHLSIIDLEAGHAVNAASAEGFNKAVCGFISKHRCDWAGINPAFSPSSIQTS